MFNNNLKKEKEELLNVISELNIKKNNFDKEINRLDDQKKNKEKEIKELEITLYNLEMSVKESQDTINQLDEMIKRREKIIIGSELKYIENSLTGLEFEQYASELLTNNGYVCSLTKASGDGGVDVIATKDGYKYAIQCKLYSGTVGNKAVQEVYSAQGLNKCDYAIVLTNSFFTNQAIEQASVLNVQLWDRNKLIELLCESFNFEFKHIDEINNIIPSSNVEYERQKEEDAKLDDDTDPLLMEAIETVIEIGQASTPFIQRRFKVGYARAGRIIDQMETRGIISGYEGSKPRQVIMPKERWEELKMKNPPV